MMAIRIRLVAIAALALLISVSAGGIGAFGISPNDTSSINVKRVDDLPDAFALGADFSSLVANEESGVGYFDEDGDPADPIDVLASGGVNWARVRVWNDPFDASGRGYGGGNVDVERATQIASRATSHGMRVLVDFHYSDFWADPAKQQSPKAWEGMPMADRTRALYEFTRESLQAMQKAGVNVGMVQIGNEANNGIAGVRDWGLITELLSAGSKAVREVFPESKIAVHFTNPEKNNYREIAARLSEARVDYDVFASSYYPYWHGSLENLTQQLTNVSREFDKEVIVAETSWAYTLEDGDGFANTIDKQSQTSRYEVSPQGQVTAFRDVVAAVAAVPNGRGIGVFYWEPTWIPVGPAGDLESNRAKWEEHGSGWATSFASSYDPDDAGRWFGGSAVDNQALFDFGGKALPSAKMFRYVRTGSGTGETDGIPLPNVPGIEEDNSAPKNFLVNPGFEDENDGNWIASGSALTLHAQDDPRSGGYSAHFYGEDSFKFKLSQTVENLESGRYRAGAFLQGDNKGATTKSILRIVTDKEMEASAEFAFDGWKNWSDPITNCLEIDDNERLTLTIEVYGNAGAWGTIDDVFLIRCEDDTSVDAPKKSPSAIQGQIPEVSASIDFATPSHARSLASTGANSAHVLGAGTFMLVGCLLCFSRSYFNKFLARRKEH